MSPASGSRERSDRARGASAGSGSRATARERAGQALEPDVPDARRPRASKRDARAAAQRERILDAAQQCFIEYGFDAASMAGIAQAAKMSAGLMYRYFPSKSAIVLAIIDRELRERRVKIAELHASADIAAGLIRSFEQWRRGDRAVMSVPLFLAMSAEAHRDPRIAAALRSADLTSRADFTAWLTRSSALGGRAIPDAVAESRAILAQCVIEGLAIRAAREPELDVARLEPALRELLDRLLSP
jgi:AcrR family transcriptional regulator